MAAQNDNLIYDGIAAFPGGINSGELPRLLQPTQASFAFNTTFRGGFATDRPKVRKINLDFSAVPEIQAPVESGLWQGGAYYKPDASTQSLMASISGRLFAFTPDAADGATVTEHTISGDPNSTTQSQSWLWPAEQFLIWNDGLNLPVFFDGNVARRSNGPAVSLGTTNATFTVPAVNSNVTLTLLANYTGPLNIIVNIGNFGNYLVVSSGTPPAGTVGYDATLRNNNDTAGGTIAVGTPVIIPGQTNIQGVTAEAFTVPTLPSPDNRVVITFTTTPNTGLPIMIAGRRYNYRATVDFALKKYRYECLDINETGTPVIVAAGTTIYYYTVTPSPDTEVGTVSVAFTIPAVLSTVAVQLSTLWTGSSFGTSVKINNKSYTLFPVVQTVTPSTALIVKNLTDTPDAARATALAVLTIPELPIGRMGTYGQGRNWMSLIDGISFTASDLVGESSGSSAYNFRDAVLKVTKNGALTNGKPFRVPNSGETIQGMSFIAQLDVALGQGPLQVFTDANVFSCQAPIDSSTWANLTSPILAESLKGAGGISQESLVNSNADLFFRSANSDLRSFKIARLDYNKWGNTPISHEMDRVLVEENLALANRCSAVEFDNRLLEAVNPVQGSQGVYHRGLMVVNFDQISTLAGKSPSIYDGLWTGLQIFRIITGRFFGVERCFAFCFNSVDSKIELWEILRDDEAFYDNETERVIWGLESSDLFRGENGNLIRTFKALEDGELSIDDVRGDVEIRVFYKPDQYPGWILWRNWTVRNDMTLDNSQPGYFPRMGLGKPGSDTCNELTDQPSRFGYTYQVRVVIQGHCRLLGARFAASHQAQPKFKAPNCDEVERTTIQIAPIDDFGSYNLGAGIQAMPS